MDRRKSLKLLATGAIAVPAVLAGCNNDEKKQAEHPPEISFNLDRAPEELERDRKLMETTFFTEHEMATIALLSDIIIPKDDISGSATDAGVPDFIEFIVKDMPQYQDPMRGGLRWLDVYCMNHFEHPFKDCTATQQMEIVDAIAYPEKAKPEFSQGVSFFTLVRNLTATGFYTSRIGVADIGYAGNSPTKWNGVPDEVLKQYNIAYTEKELKEGASYQ
ncbi:MAG: gluconate 2-dehydrogenase subunit 3 family protein [Terrimonas sp.]|nr:gluconate 2-dehydrogenase subunit 3 family protein [Terrimonas sp.]